MTTASAGGRVPKRSSSGIQRVASAKGAAPPGGAYSPAVAAGGFVFVSGQGPKDPATGRCVSGGIEEQTRQVISNIRSVLEGAGLGLTDVVKTTVYLRDMGDFKAFDRAYAEHFGRAPPARTTVQAAPPSPETMVEIEAVAKDRRSRSS